VIFDEMEFIKAILISVEFTMWNTFPLISICSRKGKVFTDCAILMKKLVNVYSEDARFFFFDLSIPEERMPRNEFFFVGSVVR
jgi:hypothetical protein